MAPPAAGPPPIPARASAKPKHPPTPPTASRAPTDSADLLDHAYASLRRLAAAKPVVGEATAAAEEIERVHLAPPFTAAIAGDNAARAAFLDYLAGAQLFDPERTPPGGMVLSMRRGPVTLCRARHRDGSVEELRLPVPPSPAPPERGGRAAAAASTDAIVQAEAAQVAAYERLPALLRTAPPWWAIWLWVARAFLALRYRRQRAELAAGAAWLDQARRPVVAAGDGADAGAAFEEARRRFVDTVRALSDARGRGDSVERLFIEVAGGPLPEEVVVLDLRPGAGADSLEHAGVDAVIIVGGVTPSALKVPLVRAALGGRGRVFFTGDPAGGAADSRLYPLGGVAPACASLHGLLVHERTRRLGQRAADVLRQGRGVLEGILDKAEAGFADRIARLELQRIADPELLIAERMSKARPLISERVHQLIQQVGVEVTSELERLAGMWSLQLTHAEGTDALRSLAAAIDEQSPAALQAARESAQRLLTGGLAGGAHDLYPAILAELPGRPDAPRPAPVPRPVDLALGDAGAGTKLGPAAPRLKSLFRSLDKIRGDVVDRLTERMHKLEHVATAGLLDAEPQLTAALLEPLQAALRATVADHGAWLDAALASERAAIEQERDRLAPLMRARDGATADLHKLTQMAASLG
jgi:hypothetical protein